MQSNEKKVKISILLLIMLVLSVISLFYQSINPFLRRKLCEDFSIVSKRDAMLVHFISIGQGDAIAINLPNGKIMLIDCGLEESNVTLANYLSSKVFHDKRNNYIDYLVLTHADIDHTGGAHCIFGLRRTQSCASRQQIFFFNGVSKCGKAKICGDLLWRE